jgi:hypothetical protein
MLSDMSTRLEHFPNELLLDVFRHVDLRDLFHGFLALNSRFNDLIRSLKSFSLTLDKDETAVTALFGPQIVRLVVSIPDDIDYRQYPNLRSLTLAVATRSQLQGIQPDRIPNLIYLSHWFARDHWSSYRISHDVFSKDFHSLRHVYFENLYSSDICSWRRSASVRYVYINCADPNAVEDILSLCHELKHLEVNIRTKKNTLVLPCSTQRHPLRLLILRFCTEIVPFYTVDNLLAFVPNVEWLRLSFTAEASFDRVALAVIDRFRCLRRFDCCIAQMIKDGQAIVDVSKIRSMHPCFNRIQCDTRYHSYRLYISGTYEYDGHIYL